MVTKTPTLTLALLLVATSTCAQTSTPTGTRTATSTRTATVTSTPTPGPAFWGLLRPDGALTDVQAQPPVGREADGAVVPIDGMDPNLPFMAPMTYDAPRRRGVLWTAEVTRRQAEQAAVDQDGASLRILYAAATTAVQASITEAQAFQALGPTPTATQVRNYTVGRAVRDEQAARLLLALLRLEGRRQGAAVSGAGP